MSSHRPEEPNDVPGSAPTRVTWAGITSKPPAVPLELCPPADSPDLELVRASLVEYVQTTYLNAEEWQGPLTLDQYLEREATLQTPDLTNNGQITGWILTSRKLPKNEDGTRPILASCESIPFHVLVGRAGVVSRNQAHGIASVYTRPEYRGKGYASRMMVELGKTLETWQTSVPGNDRLKSWKQSKNEKNEFSVLYSDIGPKFYAKAGWKLYPSTHLEMNSISATEYEAATTGLPPVEDLTTSDLRNIPMLENLEEQLRHRLQQEPNKTFVTIRPEDHIRWHFARDELQSRIVGQDFPRVKGALHAGTGLALIWYHVFDADRSRWKLHVLHAVIPSKAPGGDKELAQTAMGALILRAQQDAHQSNMAGGVEIWDPPSLVIAAVQKLRNGEPGKVELIERKDEHLCSLRWHGSPDDEVEWLNKEKYCWC